jgi:hypothetical protein
VSIFSPTTRGRRFDSRGVYTTLAGSNSCRDAPLAAASSSHPLLGRDLTETIRAAILEIPTELG